MSKNEIKKIGNTSFRVSAIKSMTLKEFKAAYKGGLKGDLSEIYKEITGKSGDNLG